MSVSPLSFRKISGGAPLPLPRASRMKSQNLQRLIWHLEDVARAQVGFGQRAAQRDGLGPGDERLLNALFVVVVVVVVAVGGPSRRHTMAPQFRRELCCKIECLDKRAAALKPDELDDVAAAA